MPNSLALVLTGCFVEEVEEEEEEEGPYLRLEY